MIDEYDDHRIKRYHNPRNLGYLKTSKKLSKSCKCDYITFQDANTAQKVFEAFKDYRLDPNKYKQMGEESFNWLTKRTNMCLEQFVNVIELKQNRISKPNKISNYFLKRISFFTKPVVIYSYFFMNYLHLKNSIKRILKPGVSKHAV